MRLGKPHLEQGQKGRCDRIDLRERVARPMLAGRPQEAVGDSGPRWMIAAA